MKTALVTGASRGIGRAIAKNLAEEGYNLHLICQNNIDCLTDFCRELSNKYHISATAYKCDVSDYDSVTDIFSRLKNLDVLVNNAGISYVGLLTDMTYEEWNRIVNVNLSSVFNTSKNAIPLMLKNHAGTIINISSVWGNVGASMEVAYSATKGGVNSFTKALARELAPSGISVNAIACGFVDTEMNSHLSAEERDIIRGEIPADRFADCEDIARSVISLIGTPSYLTGQIITVDGAWT